MRDYNSIQFRAPKSKKRVTAHPLAEEEKKQDEKPEASAATTVTLMSTGSSEPLPTPERNERSNERSMPHPLASNQQQDQNSQNNYQNHPSQQQSRPRHSPPSMQHEQPPNMNASNNTNSFHAADALAVRRDGPEATIQRLRAALDEAAQKDQAASTALSKSDAVILELRSSIRQLKRQLEKTQDEKAAAEQTHSQLQQELESMHASKKQTVAANAQDARVGELQVQLDRAHAQILTADMVRKELEDTLEAEQYTWDLRVQDQERSIQELQQECATLSQDLEQCRSQWKEAEDGWTQEVRELQSRVEKAQQEAQHWKAMESSDQEVVALKENLLALERERKELQSCLDEALKELEAVDAELQSDVLRQENERLHQVLAEKERTIEEPLQHLYRWMQESQGGEQEKHASQPTEPSHVLAAIQAHLERAPKEPRDLESMQQQVAELESQLSVYKGDLKAREESSAELRTSLKEAVALLKPLQDAVAKADREKARLEDQLQKRGNDKELKLQLEQKEDEMDRMQQEIESLEIQLSRAKLAAASSLLTPPRHVRGDADDSSLSKTREELKAKRSQEKALMTMLRDAQGRFNSLQQQNEEQEAVNSELQGRLREAESPQKDLLEAVKRDLEAREAKIDELEKLSEGLRSELGKKEKHVRSLNLQLQEARLEERDVSKVRVAEQRMHELETKLKATTEELVARKEAERALNRSLKEALGLLKPLQMHLEDAEKEKKEMAKEIRALKKRSGDDSASPRSRSGARDVDLEQLRELQETVQHLERENSQLHDALEDMSQSLNQSQISVGTGGMSQKQESRLREELVELKSRYEVTKGRLDESYGEQERLGSTLREREKEEQQRHLEVRQLREKLKRSEAELENAKFIATSALVKVEELTATSQQQSSSGNQEDLYREKAQEMEREMKSSRQQRKVPYRLT